MYVPSISLCMIVKNEQAFLARMLQSVQGIVQEMIVVDTGSTDDTVKIAKQHGAIVLSVPWEDDFAKARNVGLDKASERWILFMDADEELDQGDIAELCAYAAHEEYEGFFLQVHNHVRMEQGGTTVNPILRMFKNLPQYRFEGAIHEQISASILYHCPAAQFHVSNVKIHHYGYTREVILQKNKYIRNITLLQKELERDPTNSFHLYNIAIEYWRGGSVAKAYETFHQARVQLSPLTNYTHLVLKYEACCLAALGRMREAVELCQEGVQFYRDYTDLYHHQASFLSSLGLFERAKIAAAQAIQIGPPKAHYHTEEGMGAHLTWYQLGKFNEATHDYDIAINCYAEAMRLRPSFHTALYRIFRILRCTGRESDVAKLLSERFAVHSPQVYMKVVSILYDAACYAAVDEVVKQNSSKWSDPSIKQTVLMLQDLARRLYGAISPGDNQEPNAGEDASALSFGIQSAYASGHLTQVMEKLNVFRSHIVNSSLPAEDYVWTTQAFVHCLSALCDKHLTVLLPTNLRPLITDVRLQLPSKFTSEG
ncbi:glycosyltransferase [Alicyclobacillus tolerans]|uniref:glycosyltransferase n=1 Tax=Alicyclobacillus tolerans TaxID=90970 RepID=UPI001F164D25|nr:glycosyltransferase [Alicyclobacillus tolerans]MCF8567610.1 glycosyltransferase [Alicyclobacillus tolerans]